MAKRHSLHAAESLLEKAVAYRDTQGIRIATTMLNHILTVQPDPYEGYIKIDVRTDAFLSSKRGESLRPVECKPGDCTKDFGEGKSSNCFWFNWCEMKETFDLFAEADGALKRFKESMQRDEFEAKPVHKDTAEKTMITYTPSREDERKREDWQIIRKEAKDTLTRMKGENS